MIVEAPDPLLAVREFGALLKPDRKRWIEFCRMFTRSHEQQRRSWHQALADLYQAPEWLVKTLFSDATLQPDIWTAANLNQMMRLERAINGPTMRLTCSVGVLLCDGVAFVLPEHVAAALNRPHPPAVMHQLHGAAASAAYEANERGERELYLRLLAAHFDGCDREQPPTPAVGLSRKQALALARSWSTDASPYRFLRRELLPRVMLPSDFDALLAGRDFRSRRTLEFVTLMLDMLERSPDSAYPFVVRELRSMR